MASVEEERPLLADLDDFGISGSQRLAASINSATSGLTDFHVYRRRWFILIVLILLSISNGMIWITFSPIADVTAQYYKISSVQVNALSVVYMITCIPTGLLATWFLGKTGLRTGIILSAWLNAVGCFIRVVSTFAVPLSWRYPLVLCGQAISSLAQPVVLFAPTEIAAVWFAADQRALANTMASTSNAIGIMLGNLLSPATINHGYGLPFLLWMYMIPAGVVVCMATFGVCSSKPPTPPTHSAALPAEPFIQGIKDVARNKHYWVLALTFGMGLAVFTVTNSLLQQILCPQGYSDAFAGWCAALNIVFGLIGAACAALYVDRTKQFVEVAKFGLGMSVMSFLAFYILVRYPGQEVALLIVICVAGFFGFASNPICLELSVETTFPVNETTCAGLLVISGQIQSAVCVILMTVLSRSYDVTKVPLQTCSDSSKGGDLPMDFTVADIFLSVYASLVVVLFVIYYKCDYKRMRAEECRAAEEIINHSQNLHSVT